MNVSPSRPAALSPTLGGGGASRSDQSGMAVVLLVLIFAAFLFSANSTTGQRNVIAGVLAVVLFPLAWFLPRVGLPVVAIYMTTMGGFRRLLIPAFGYTELDPLLLVGPIVAVLCFVNLVTNKQLRPTTKVGKWTLVLMALMAVAVVNPLQGSILVGISGIFFYIVPIMWYCVGRNTGTPQIMTALIRTLLVITILGALLGLKQGFFGFSDAEQLWFRESGFSLAVIGTQRTMSFFTAPSEYGSFLSIGIVIAFSYFLRGARLAVVPMLLLFYGLLLTSQRGAVVGTAGACMVMWAVQGRSVRAWIPRIVAAALVLGIGGYISLKQLSSVTEAVGGNDGGAVMLNHQIEGLTDPFGKGSTAGGHLALIGWGIMGGIRTPIGHGLGSTTMGSGRFGGTATFSSEYDIGSMFWSLGVFGGVVFVGMIVATYRTLGLYWYHTRSHIPLVMIGILVTSQGSWLAPGHYAQSAIVWIMIGCVDRIWRDGRLIPGLTQKLAGRKTSLSIWKQAIARRLSGASPSWEASYRRAGGGTSLDRTPPGLAGAGLPDPQTVPDDGEAEPPAPKPRRITPSAQRALERASGASRSDFASEGSVNEGQLRPRNEQSA
ncbi:MAG: hypothetical protein H7Z41_10870 [Cytophagales bacterium]|nr:hypothetical protein [Armatimonadota bacterium]